MASQFTQEMLQTYICATVGNMFADAIIRGFQGNAAPMEFTDSLLDGFQTATTYVAYPIAVKALSKVSKKYKKAVESLDDEDCGVKRRLGVFVIGGITAAGITTVVNFPIKVAQERRREKGVSVEVTPKQLIKYTADQIGANIGTNASAAILESHIPIPHSHLLRFGRNHAINTLSNLGGLLTTMPTDMLLGQQHEPIISAIGAFLTSQIFTDMVLFESVDHFMKLC